MTPDSLKSEAKPPSVEGKTHKAWEHTTNMMAAARMMSNPKIRF